MKKVLSLALVLLMAVSVFAIGGKETTAKADDEAVTLSVYWWGNQVRNDVTQKAIDLYMKQNPGIKIKTEFTDWSGYWDKLAATAAGGKMPDIIQMDYAYIHQYQASNLLADLTPYIKDGTIDTANVPQSIIDSGSLYGKVYAISLGSNAPCMIYDKAITDKAGITIPEQLTLSELYELGEIIYEKTGVKTYFDGGLNMMQVVARCYGSHLFDELANNDPTSVLKHFENVVYFNDSEASLAPDIRAEKNPEVVESKPIINGTTWNDFAYSNQYIAVLNAAGRPLAMTMYPKMDDATTQPMFLKPSLFFSVAESSTNKKEAAAFIDWFTNSVEANKILGAERGIPISIVVADGIKPVVSAESAYIFDYIAAVGEIATSIDAPDPNGKDEIDSIGKTLVEDVRYGDCTAGSAAFEFVSRSYNILLQAQ